MKTIVKYLLIVNVIFFTTHSFANVFSAVGYEYSSNEFSAQTNKISVNFNSVYVSVGYLIKLSDDITLVPEVSLGKGLGKDEVSGFRYGGDLLGKEEISLDTSVNISTSLQYQTEYPLYTFASIVYSKVDYKGELTKSDLYSDSSFGIAAGLGYNQIKDLDVLLTASSVEKRKSLKLGIRYHF